VTMRIAATHKKKLGGALNAAYRINWNTGVQSRVNVVCVTLAIVKQTSALGRAYILLSC
jgi:hypothetical protein